MSVLKTGRPGRERPSNYSQRKQNYFTADDPYTQCREKAGARGIIPPDNILFNEIVHCPVEGKGRGNKSGRLFLRPDGSGWLCNYTDGLGVENFQPQRSGRLTPVERARIGESIRRGRLTKLIESWAKIKRRYYCDRIYENNQILTQAEARLEIAPGDERAMLARDIVHQNLTRLEERADYFSTRDLSELIEAFYTLEGVL